MPRDGSDIYVQPFPDVTEGTEIESAVYNGFVSDIAIDLNTPRPIIAGGTGATDADSSLVNLGGEKAAQVVTNYDSHVFYPGSFYSATSATNPPVAAHAFAGIAYINEALADPPTNLNVIVEARDLDDAVTPGAVYVREKAAGVWGAWTAEFAGLATTLDGKVDVAGDTMTGHLGLPAGPSASQAVRKDYVDGADTTLSATLTTAIALKADIASPTFTGDPKAPTPTAGDNDTSIATTAFVTGAVTTAAGVGSVVQSVFTSYAAHTGISTAIPFDDTIPQSSEGGHFMTATIVPTSATNKLRIRIVVFGAGSTTDVWPVVSLFRDAATSAIAATSTGTLTQTALVTVPLEWELVAGSTASTEFRVQAGPRGGGGGTFYLNGVAANRLFGGVAHCTMTVEEIKV